MRVRLVRVGVLGASVTVAAACAPTYAPPIRSTHVGAPGRLSPTQGEIAAAFNAAERRPASLGVGIPLHDQVRLVLNVDGAETRVIGSAGLTWTHRAPSQRAFMDGEFGVGAGAGGERCGNPPPPASPTMREASCSTGSGLDGVPAGRPDGRGPFDRVAGGGYVGVGVGLRPWRWVEVFLRGRLQVARATAVPLTLWASTALGADVKLGPVRLYAAIGGAWYYNDEEHNGGIFLEAGLSVPIEMRRPRPATVAP